MQMVLSSTTSDTMQSKNSSDSSPDTTIMVGTVRGRARPRKGHTKSRNGCINCKRRRNCRRLGMKCEYSTRRIMMDAPSRPLQSTPTQFTMDDLRLYQHFIFHAYPPMPLNGEPVWKEVAAMSHNFDFLVHAMLGLAASHLSLSGDIDYTAQALSHRVHAITLLNQALSKPCKSKVDADARIATVMTLIFQSSYMFEGMVEFIIMIRGCRAVSDAILPRLENSLFEGFTAESHNKHVLSLNPVDVVGEIADILGEGLVSVRRLRPICQSVIEVKYLGILERILEIAKKLAPFTEAALAYAMFGDLEQNEFKHFTNRRNYAAQIIIAHFFIIEYIVATVAMASIMGSFPFRRAIISAWASKVAENVPSNYNIYMSWPLEFAKSDRLRLKSG
ncbi:hypothetical protein QL093DRAFT_2565883 [Fusarium oxysporum]|nr:hypothetical protein QL093DRAFT_2565883 [Fusarium oxysporum]